MLNSQGDGELIFVHAPGTAGQKVERLALGTQGGDDVAWTTSSTGTLYVVDAQAGDVYTISGHFKPDTVFIACPNDAGVAGFVGTVDLTTGVITPWAIGLGSPKGLLFVPGNPK